MRLIDADALFDVFAEKRYALTKLCGGYRYLDAEGKAEYDKIEESEKYITDAPTIDPVVRGEWSVFRRYKLTPSLNGYKCSICQRVEQQKTDYCPNCGAKMDKED